MLRQRIGQFSELFLLELLAQFRDRLRDYLCLHSSSVQVLRMIVARPRKFSHLSLICLPLGFLTWLLRKSSSILSNWIHLCWGSLWLSGRFQSLVGMFWLIWGIRPCRSFAGKLWQDFPHLSVYLSPLDAKHNLHKSESSSPQKRVVYTRTLLSSAQDLLAREMVSIAVIACDSNLKKRRFYVGWNFCFMFSDAKNISNRTLQQVWSK